MPVSRLLLALLTLSLTATAALAQAPAASPNTAPPLQAGSQQGWIAVVMAVVLIIAVGIGSFMSAKRTHQD